MATQKLSILYIDDDADDHLFFKLALANIAIPSILNQAFNGKEGMELLEKMSSKPNHIFLDLSMPIMNGLEFLKEKQKIEPYKDIPTYVYSTSSRHADITDALALGADKFFTKPNQVDSIREILEATLID
jgi:CitB family two-component system response regulator MalR